MEKKKYANVIRSKRAACCTRNHAVVTHSVTSAPKAGSTIVIFGPKSCPKAYHFADLHRFWVVKWSSYRLCVTQVKALHLSPLRCLSQILHTCEFNRSPNPLQNNPMRQPSLSCTSSRHSKMWPIMTASWMPKPTSTSSKQEIKLPCREMRTSNAS